MFLSLPKGNQSPSFLLIKTLDKLEEAHKIKVYIILITGPRNHQKFSL